MCLDRGQCAFIAGFKRLFETPDINGHDFKFERRQNITYESYGFYAQYIKNNFFLAANAVDRSRYAISPTDIKIGIEAQAPLPTIKYPTKEDQEGLSLGLIELGGATVNLLTSISIVLTGLSSVLL